LERGRNGFRLTEAGKVIFELAKQIEEQLRHAEESIYNLRGVEGGRIRIGVISPAKYFMSKAIAALLRDHLEIQLDLKVSNRQEIVTGLCSASFDFVIKGSCFIVFLPNKELNEAKAWRWAVMNPSSKVSWQG
jgi:DNA-binding transcriptional LysR family regulator